MDKTFGQRLRELRLQTTHPQSGKPFSQEQLGDCLARFVTDLPANRKNFIYLVETDQRRLRFDDERHILLALVDVLYRHGAPLDRDETTTWFLEGGYKPLSDAEALELDANWIVEESASEPPISTTNISIDSSIHVTQQSFGAIFSLKIVKHWFHTFFKTNEASNHVRSSWKGWATYGLRVISERIGETRWYVLILWPLVLWAAVVLFTPILSWPHATSAERLSVSWQFALLGIVIPIAISLLVEAERRDDYLTLPNGKRKLWQLKLTGAAMGFNLFAVIALLLSLGWYLATGRTVGNLFIWIGILTCTFWGMVAASRTPLNWWIMFDGKPKLDSGDLLILVVSILLPALCSLAVYFFYDFITAAWFLPLAILTLAAVGFWENRKKRHE